MKNLQCEIRICQKHHTKITIVMSMSVSFFESDFIEEFLSIIGIICYWQVFVGSTKSCQIANPPMYRTSAIIFFTAVYMVERLVLQTVYVLKKEILQFLCLKSAVYNLDLFQIKNGL